MPLMYLNTDPLKNQLEIHRQNLELMQLPIQMGKEQDTETYNAISKMTQFFRS